MHLIRLAGTILSIVSLLPCGGAAQTSALSAGGYFKSHAFGFQPATPIDVGIARFVQWYRDYYAV